MDQQIINDDFQSAVDEVDLTSMQRLLKKNPDTDLVESSLRKFIRLKNLEAVKIILKHMPDLGKIVMMDERFEETALLYSIRKGSDEVTEHIFHFCERSVWERNEDGQNCFHVAIEKPSIFALKLFLSDKICIRHGLNDFDGHDSNGNAVPRFSPFTLAAKLGNIEALELLIEHVPVNKMFHEGQTALHAAAEYGQSEAVEFLLRRGAYVRAFDDAGCTPLFYAARGDHHEIAETLIKQGAAVWAGNRHGITILEVAGVNCSVNTLRLILARHQHGKILETYPKEYEEDNQDAPDLWHRCRRDARPSLTRALELACGSSVHARAADIRFRGFEFAGYASEFLNRRRYRQKEAVDILLKAGANPCRASGDGPNAWALATANGLEDIIALFRASFPEQEAEALNEPKP